MASLSLFGFALPERTINFDAKPYWASGAICVGVVTVVAGAVLPPIQFAPDTISLAIVVAIMALPSAVFAFSLPHLTVGPMTSMWRVPRSTYLLSRPMLRLIGTAMIGSLIGIAILAPFSDATCWIILAGFAPSVVLHIVSATRRFRRHSISEFVTPSPFPYPLRRRMRR